MLIDHIKKAFIAAISTIKNFSFAIKDELLKIESNCFGYTEVFCVLRNAHFHFFTYSEKMIDSITAGENYSGMILNINLLFTEIFCRDGLKPDKRIKIKLHIKFSTQLEVRR